MSMDWRSCLSRCLSGVACWAGAASAQPMEIHARHDTAAFFEPEPAALWDGFYLGAVGGYNLDAVTTRPVIPGGVNNWSRSGLMSASGAGGVAGGLVVGRNLQFDDGLVLGAEGDFGYVAHANWRGANPTPVNGSYFYSGENNSGWLGSLRGRVGVNYDRAMFYVTGGLASASVAGAGSASYQYGALTSNLPPRVAFGAVMGAGFEYHLKNRWLFRGEYLYYTLGKREFSLSGPGYLGSPASYSATQDNRGHLFRVGFARVFQADWRR